TGEDGVAVTATDLVLTVRERVDAGPHAPLRVAVDAGNLHAFVHAADGDDVTLQLDDAACLAVCCGRAKCDLLVLPADEFPVFQSQGGLPVEFDADLSRFMAALCAVAPSAADETSTRRYLCGVFLEEAQRLVSTDGNRLASFAFGGSVAAPVPPSCIVPS